MSTSRRGFLTGLVGLFAAPAIVRASSLMPVKEVKPLTLYTMVENWNAAYASEFIREFEVERGFLMIPFASLPPSKELTAYEVKARLDEHLRAIV